MADFEAACQARSIALYVVPPSSPKLNGCAERAMPDSSPRTGAALDVAGAGNTFRVTNRNAAATARHGGRAGGRDPLVKGSSGGQEGF